jgi:hypothetical protein
MNIFVTYYEREEYLTTLGAPVAYVRMIDKNFM